MGTTNKDDILDFLKNNISSINKETERSVGNRFYTWSEHHNNWIDFVQPILRNISEYEKTNSLIIFRLLEMQNILLWIWFSAISGRYHASIRELRYMLDAFMQAYYLDIEHPDSNILCKMEILKENELLFGGRLIDKLNVKYNAELKKIYRDLSKYVHSSYEELKPVIVEGKVDIRIMFAFDQHLFDKCEEFTNKVMDFIFLLTLNKFNQIKDILNKDKMTVSSLENLKCNLTLNYLRKSVM